MRKLKLGIMLLGTACVALGMMSFKQEDPENPVIARLLKFYSVPELQYFKEVAFRNETLSRWHEDIRIQVQGQVSQAQVQEIDELIGELRQVLGEIQISRVSTDGNFTINFPKDIAEFKQHFHKDKALPLGYAVPVVSGNLISSAQIFLHPSLIGQKRKQVLLHEVCHALGLLDHTESAFKVPNLMGAANYQVNGQIPGLIPALDKAALRLLYSELLSRDLKEEYLVFTAAKSKL